MSALAFDTHAFIKKLEAAGFTEQQAEALAETQANLLTNQLATKSDIETVQRDIKELICSTHPHCWRIYLDNFEDIWEQYWQIVDNVRAVDEAVAAKAVGLRRAAGRRLPNGDALIAATAVLAGATLVHRDPYFSAIPPALLQQIELPRK